MKKSIRVRMQVSIASSTFSYQPSEVVDLSEDQARAWLAVGHAVRVSPSTPLTDREIDLHDVDATEALTRHCVHCERRAAYVLGNKPYCPQHFRAELGV